MSRPHIATIAFCVGILCGVASVCAGATATVTGKVCDSAGKPQIGAVVQLLRPDLSVTASVFTDAKGRYFFATVFPGKYSIKAMGPSFLPSMRENVRVRSATVVNITLNSLYEVMQWLPAQARSSTASEDDWAWTLRSSVNRPLLRWLEDGPLVVTSDGSRRAPHLKARLMAIGRSGTFGEEGSRLSVEMEDTPTMSRELLARIEFSPVSDAGAEASLGFRQDLGFAGNVESMAAVALHPEIMGTGTGGLQMAHFTGQQTIDMGDLLSAVVGSDQVLARFSDQSPNLIAAVLPFASVTYRQGASSFHYRVATTEPSRADSSMGTTALFALSEQNGRLALEHGLHQELGWERHTEQSGVQLLVFADHVRNPMLEAAVRLSDGSSISGAALYDPTSGLLRTTGANYSSTGMLATIEHRLPGGNQLRLSYANGDALVIDQGPANGPAASVSLAALASTHAHRAQMYTLALSGTVEGTHTRWRASYRWQPETSVTQIAPYVVDLNGPYLNIRVRQQIRAPRVGSPGIEALFGGRNLLAQGYSPWSSADGSLLVYSEGQRSVSGGLAFTF